MAVEVLFLGTGTSHGVPMIGCTCEVCGSTDPRDVRSRPSIYLVADDGTSVLVDTTPDLRHQCLRHGITRVDAVFYTHAHADHIFGFDELRRFNVLANGPVRAFGTRPTLDALRRTFAYAFDAGTPRGGGVPDVDLIEVEGPVVIGGVRIEPLTVLHGGRPVLGFRTGRFAYLTDCNEIPDATHEALTGLQVVVIDALRRRPHPTHFSLSQAVDAARRINAEQTWFTHMCHDLGHAATDAELPPGMALAYDGLRLSCA